MVHLLLIGVHACSEWMRMRQRSSPATFDCLISEIAVTRVSIAEAYSPLAASYVIMMIIQ